MSRIAGVPEQLRAAATVIAQTAPELDLAAVALASAALPEMPPGVAASVQGTISQASSTLHRAAATAGHTGRELKRRGLWLELADAGPTAWALGLTAKAAIDLPFGLMDFAERKRGLDMLRIWGRYERAVLPIARDYGEQSMQATKMWLLFQRSHPEFATKMMTIADGAGELGKYERAADVPFPLIRGVGGKILGPVGVLSSSWLLLHPEHEHGWERTGDRIAGGAGVIGGAGATMAAFGGLEAVGLAVPGVNIAVATLIVGAAAWDLYTHRKEVAHALAEGGKFLWDHKAIVVAGPAGAAAQEVWDHRRDIARGAVTVGEFGVHRAEDAAHIVTSAPGTLVHAGGGVVHEGKKLLGKIGL